MRQTLFNERMMNINVTLPKEVLEKVEQLAQEFAKQGIALNRAATIRYVIQSFFDQRERGDSDG